MDNKTNNFQIILIAVFAVCIIVGVIIFSKAKGDPGIVFPEITIWGTAPQGVFDKVYGEVNAERNKKDGILKITYVEKRAEDFDHDFIEALAGGVGPDAIILSQDLIIRYQDKLFTIPFKSFPLRDFRDTYIDEAELFVNEEGILGFPFYVDPLVMYWNKDTLSSAGIATTPKLWTEFIKLAQVLTEKDKNNNITRSAVALGEYGNITNAKEILSALFLQAGTPITKIDNGVLKSALNQTTPSFLSPAESVLNFYTEFSNPSKVSYSWNRSMIESKDLFIAGDLAFYFGFASELSSLRAKNPNLNFDVAEFPQGLLKDDARTKITYGKIYVFSAVKSGKQITGTLQSLIALLQNNFISLWAENYKIAPTRRDLLPPSVIPEDPDLKVFYDSAIKTRGWFDPNVNETNAIFKNLVESISSGRLRTSEAINNASRELDNLIIPR